MLIAAVTLLSCTSTKNNNLAYFKDLGANESGTLANPQGSYPILIQPNDELVIAVTSAVPEATAAYNLPMDNPATRGNLRQTTQPRTQTYIVDSQGYIMMPVLGRIYVNGKTLGDISKEITAMVAQDVKDPYVRVDIVNFSVDVMGEVKSPQRVYTGSEHFTVLDALSQCGDLTEYGKRDRVYVIRTEEGKRTYHRLDLTNSEVFNSPFFYLKQNDVVYVKPKGVRLSASGQTTMTFISAGLSLVSIIVNTILWTTRR